MRLKQFTKVLGSLFVVLFSLAQLSQPAAGYHAAADPALPAGVETHTAGGALQAADCAPIDLIFLVDASRSGIAQDAQQIQSRIVRWMVGLAGYDRMYTCPGVTHRIGIVRYGEEARIDEPDLDLTPVNPNLSEDVTRWHEKWDELSARTSGNEKGAKRNFSAALKKASEMFRAAGSMGGAARKQWIVLFSANGGAPCDDTSQCAYYEMDEQMSALETTTLDALPFTENSGPYLWVYTFRDPSELASRYTSYWESITQRLNGGLVQATTEAPLTPLSVAGQLTDLFQKLNPGSALRRLSDCTFQIDAFQQTAGFLVFKNDSQKGLDIQVNSGQNVMRNSIPDEQQQMGFLYDAPQPSASDSSDYFVYHRPAPGEWQLVGECQKTVALAFALKGGKLSNFNPGSGDTLAQYYLPEQPNALSDPANPYILAFQLTDPDGKPFREYPGYEARVTASVSGPNSLRQDIAFVYDPENAAFRSKAPLPVRDQGDYQWQITFEAPRGVGTQQVYYEPLGDTVTGSYTVKPVTPIHPVLTVENVKGLPVHESWLKKGPRALTSFNLNVEEFPVQVSFVDNQGKPVELKKLEIGDPGQAVKVTLTYMGGARDQEAPQEVYLQPEPGNLLSLKGYVGNQIGRPGNYLVEAAVDAEYNRNLYRLVNNEAEPVNLTRTDGIFRSPGVLRAVQVASLLALILLVVIAVLTFTNPVDGTLLFYRAGGYGSSYQAFASLPVKGILPVRLTMRGSKSIYKTSKVLRHIRSILTLFDFRRKDQNVVIVKMKFDPQYSKEPGRTLMLYAQDEIDLAQLADPAGTLSPNTPTSVAHLPGGILVCFQRAHSAGK